VEVTIYLVAFDEVKTMRSTFLSSNGPPDLDCWAEWILALRTFGKELHTEKMLPICTICR
jgi:hypothetical protein